MVYSSAAYKKVSYWKIMVCIPTMSTCIIQRRFRHRRFAGRVEEIDTPVRLEGGEPRFFASVPAKRDCSFVYCKYWKSELWIDPGTVAVRGGAFLLNHFTGPQSRWFPCCANLSGWPNTNAACSSELLIAERTFQISAPSSKRWSILLIVKSRKKSPRGMKIVPSRNWKLDIKGGESILLIFTKFP